MNKTTAVSSASSATSYSGAVAVKLRHKGKEFPFMFFNHGTKYMLDALSKIMAGYTDVDIAPRYFDFQHKGSGDSYISCLSSPLKLVGAIYGEAAGATSDTGAVLFNVLLNHLDKSSAVTLNSPRIALLADNGQPVATIDDAKLQDVWKSIVPGTEALFEWKMTFMNGGNDSVS